MLHGSSDREYARRNDGKKKPIGHLALSSRLNFLPILISSISSLALGFFTFDDRPFVGDDLQVRQAILEERYLVKWTDIFVDTTLDKYRPANNLFVFLGFQILGNSPIAFWAVSTFLVAALAGTVAFFVLKHGVGEGFYRKAIAILAGILVATSPMTFMARQASLDFSNWHRYS